jgi:hypothetical protein
MITDPSCRTQLGINRLDFSSGWPVRFLSVSYIVSARLTRFAILGRGLIGAAKCILQVLVKYKILSACYVYYKGVCTVPSSPDSRKSPPLADSQRPKLRLARGQRVDAAVLTVCVFLRPTNMESESVALLQNSVDMEQYPTMFDPSTLVKKVFAPIRIHGTPPLETHSLYYEQHGTGEKVGAQLFGTVVLLMSSLERRSVP